MTTHYSELSEKKRKQRCFLRNKNYQIHKKEIALRAKQKREGEKQLVINHYSKNKSCCQICGYSDIRALQLDHINNGGARHRKTIKRSNIYIWIIQNNFPAGFQVLCANCNWIKREEIYGRNR